MKDWKGPETGRCLVNLQLRDSRVEYDLILFGADPPSRLAAITGAISAIAGSYREIGAKVGFPSRDSHIVVTCHPAIQISHLHQEVMDYLIKEGIRPVNAGSIPPTLDRPSPVGP